MRVLVPLDEDAGLRSRISEHFGRAPYLAIVELAQGRARLLGIRPNPSAHGGHGGACGVLDLLAAFGAECVLAKRVGVRAARRLMASGVEVYETAAGTLGEALAELEAGHVRPMDLASLASRSCARPDPYPPGPPFPWPPMGPGPGPGPPPGPTPITPVSRPAELGRLSGRLKIAFSTNGRSGLDDVVADRFARCPTFTVVEVEDGRVINVEVHDNPFVNYPHGAGFAAAQFLANLGVKIVVSSRFGPKAWQALASLGLSIHVVPAGTRVRDALRSLTG